MSLFKFILDAAIKIFTFFKGYWRHAYKNRLIMYLFITVPGTLFIAIALGFYMYVTSEYNNTTHNFSERRELLYKENEYRYALDNLAVCTDSISKQLSDADFFCKRAMELYRKSVANTDSAGVDVGYDHKTYSLTQIDLNFRLRLLEISRYEIDRPFSKIMNSFMFRFNMALIILGIGYAIMIITSILFYIHRNKPNNGPDDV